MGRPTCRRVRSRPEQLEPRTTNERLLVALVKLPRAVPILGVLVLLVLGAVIPGWGWICTAVVAAFLIWMLALSWPRLAPVERLGRIAVVVLIAGIALIQARPRG